MSWAWPEKEQIVIKIYGHSDDCLEIGGDADEEFGAINKRVEILIGDKTAGVVVGGRYGDAGVWEFDVRQVDEGVPVPWPISIRAGTPWARTT